jgi:asparagine synthase (glutamine-hydrolysing)
VCGIAGFRQPAAGFDREGTLARMLERLVHRGPDASGTFCSGDVFLGHRRLSIVDLSSEGNQPMFNEDGSVSIVYNGELYDYHDLRGELERKGHRFRSRSDTEVILHLYEEKGIACVEELRGMFAFALHDARRDRLFLARDRLGIKPLYWSRAGGAFSFASELSALLACPWIPREVDPSALSRYLCFFYVPAPLSMLREVSMLEPGETLVEERSSVSVRSYWRAASFLDADPQADFSRAEFDDELDALLGDTVRVHLNADVPVGAFLSGGVDSSGIVAYMQRFAPDAKTFCLVHDDPDYDERAYAAQVARRFGTDHVEVKVHGGERFDVGLLDFLVDAYGEPMASPSAIAVHSVIQAMKGRVKCVLSGDGADEIFAGYEHYAWLERVRRLQGVLPRALARPLLPVRRLLRFPGGARAARAIERASWGIADFLIHEKGFFGFAEQAELLSGDVLAELDLERESRYLQDKLALRDDAPSSENLYRFMVLQQLADYMLTKVDRASMGHSVEVRVPYVDHRVFELLCRVPAAEKFDPAVPKPILKRVLGRHLPAEVLYRPKKGFAVHLERFLGDSFWSHLEALVEDPSASDYFDRKALLRVVSELRAGRPTAAERVRSMYRIWTLAVFLHWRQRALRQ